MVLLWSWVSCPLRRRGLHSTEYVDELTTTPLGVSRDRIGRERAARLASRNEAVEQDTEAKYSMQGQYLVEGTARQETCKPQNGSKRMDASASTSSSWRTDGQSSKIDSRLVSRPKSSRWLHNGGTSWSSARRQWTMTVQA